MAMSLVLLPAIFTSLLFFLADTSALDSQIYSQPASFCSDQLNQNSVRCELEELQLKIARLESILEQNNELSNAKSLHISESEKKIEDLTLEINRLRYLLSNFEDDSLRANQRLNALEKEMAEIVSEQWIQLQQLEQAIHLAEMRTLKVKRKGRWARCPFVKFIKTTFARYLELLNGILDPYVSQKESAWGPCKSQILKAFSAAKLYHHQLQGFIKHSMESNGLTAAFAHQEVVFFLASALVAFPVMSMFMLLVSRFN